MIHDLLQRGQRYVQWMPHTAAAFEFLRQHAGPGLKDGRHEIDGDRCFALAAHNDTRDPVIFHPESHRKYMDIQYLVSGRETIVWTPLDEVGPATQEYDETKDILFYERNDRGRPFVLSQGDIAIFLPDDAHQPGCHAGPPGQVHKVVVKVRVT